VVTASERTCVPDDWIEEATSRRNHLTLVPPADRLSSGAPPRIVRGMLTPVIILNSSPRDCCEVSDFDPMQKLILLGLAFA